MPRPHVFRLDKFIRHILGDAVCAWFGRKRVGTGWERTLTTRRWQNGGVLWLYATI